MRALSTLLLALLISVFTVQTVAAKEHCEFKLGFATLRDLIGHDIVGECLENEHWNAIGDSNQRTTGGLMAWRKADNWTAFTDGYRTWINGPHGLVQRLNTERFEWEADYAPGGGVATPTPIPATPTPITGPNSCKEGEQWTQAQVWDAENLDAGPTQQWLCVAVEDIPQPTPTPSPAPLDTRLVPALERIGDGNSIGRDLVAYALSQNVGFRIAPIPDVAGQTIMGTYSRSSNTITVSDTYVADAPTVVLAGMLVHELAHVLPTPPEWADLDSETRCFNREFEAEYFSGLWWYLEYGHYYTAIDHRDARHLEKLALYVSDKDVRGNLHRLNRYVRERFAEICASR